MSKENEMSADVKEVGEKFIAWMEAQIKEARNKDLQGNLVPLVVMQTMESIVAKVKVAGPGAPVDLTPDEEMCLGGAVTAYLDEGILL